MKFSRFLAIFLFLTAAAFGQTTLPNIAYSGMLNATCATPNAACSNAIFVTGMGSTGQATSFGSGSALDIPVANYSAATVTVSGTYAGATINFEFSDPTSGTNYFQEFCARTDINLLEVNEVLPTNQVRAWQCPVWAATRFRVRMSAYTSGAATVYVTLTQVAIDPSLVVAASITNIAGASDPCLDVSALKTSAFANISTAATTSLVALSGTSRVYVCGFQVVSSSTTTANTIYLEYGGGAACATSPTVLTPTYSNLAAAATPATIQFGPGSSVLTPTPAGTGLCAVTTVGSTPVISVLVTYVQQ